jgi:hypothetical protein
MVLCCGPNRKVICTSYVLEPWAACVTCCRLEEILADKG